LRNHSATWPHVEMLDFIGFFKPPFPPEPTQPHQEQNKGAS
jgi:hypothetical protein